MNKLFVLHWQPLKPPTAGSSTHKLSSMNLPLGLGKVVIPRGWHLGEKGWRGFCTVFESEMVGRMMRF